MPIRHIQTELHHRAVVHGNTIYLSGMVADDKSLPIRRQTRQALEKIDALLATLGSSAANLLFVMIYLADVKDRDGMNAEWSAFFENRPLPARATVGAGALGPGTLIEIVATAAF